MDNWQWLRQYGPLVGRTLLALIFHNFWAVDAEQYQNQFNHFFKNVCIMGGMLYVMAFDPGPLSLGKDS
jgi:putative oxidoreductase